MITRLYRKVTTLYPSHLWLFVKVTSLAFIVRLALITGTFKRTVNFLSKFSCKPASTPTPAEIESIKRIITWTYHFAPVLNCLSICTTYWWVLKRSGLATELKFGMAKSGPKLIAHAWLLYNGEVLSYEKDPRKMYVDFQQSILS